MGCQKLKTRYGDSEGILGGIFVALEGWVDGNFFFHFFSFETRNLVWCNTGRGERVVRSLGIMGNRVKRRRKQLAARGRGSREDLSVLGKFCAPPYHVTTYNTVPLGEVTMTLSLRTSPPFSLSTWDNLGWRALY